MNKYSFKNRMIFTIAYTLAVAVIMSVVVLIQYKRINYRYNVGINAICNLIEDKYPDADISEVIACISDDAASTADIKNILSEYGIDIKNEAAVIDNDKSFYVFLGLDLAIGIAALVILYMIMNSVFRHWDRKLEEITRDLSKINAGDYRYDMNTGEEGKLSILESEVYKTAIKCRESAENSLKDKEKLKESLSDISHQLKTPITSLMINLDNLEEFPDLAEEKKQQLISNAKRDVNKVNQMVQMLLKLSRLDADAIEFIQKDNSADSIIIKAIENVLALCDLKDVKLFYKETAVTEDNIQEVISRADSSETDKIYCDSYWETEAISNILKNGIEHACTKVSISFAGYEMYSEIRIENDGEQISNEEAGKIFTRYYRGENSVADSVGIGLSLADSIVRRDGGYIIAKAYEKENGETGTIFIVRYMK